MNSIASVEVIGESYEGRKIYAVKVSTSPNNRKAILIDASTYKIVFFVDTIPISDLDSELTFTFQFSDIHAREVQTLISLTAPSFIYEFNSSNY